MGKCLTRFCALRLYMGLKIISPIIFRGLIRSSFGVFPIPSGGRTVVQPVWVEDLVTCMLWSLENEDTLNKVYELGGSEFFTLQQIIETIMDVTHRQRYLVPLSPITLRAMTVFFEGVIPKFPHLIFLARLLCCKPHMRRGFHAAYFWPDACALYLSS